MENKNTSVDSSKDYPDIRIHIHQSRGKIKYIQGNLVPSIEAEGGSVGYHKVTRYVERGSQVNNWKDDYKNNVKG